MFGRTHKEVHTKHAFSISCVCNQVRFTASMTIGYKRRFNGYLHKAALRAQLVYRKKCVYQHTRAAENVTIYLCTNAFNQCYLCRLIIRPELRVSPVRPSPFARKSMRKKQTNILCADNRSTATVVVLCVCVCVCKFAQTNNQRIRS